MDPDNRQLYIEALRPPLDYHLAEAVATTYSLDLTRLLEMPLALVLPDLDVRRLGKESAVAVYDALQRASKRITVFCDRGSIAPPSVPHVLYGMLEPVVVEVDAPGGGCLHAKMWLMRFEPDPNTEGEPLMRLVVLSRNLTADRCWDVSVVLDGRLAKRNRAANHPLGDLLDLLPGRALRPLPAVAAQRVERLSKQVRCTEWELPPNFDAVYFHALGLTAKPRPWLPEPSDRLLVMAPFVRADALQDLAETTHDPVALIARGEELDRIAADTLGLFGKTYVLSDHAAIEDGEDVEEGPDGQALRGLHAKMYVAKRGWDTHLYVGSANASNAALRGTNIELLAELVGKTSKIGDKAIDRFLAPGGLGALLVEYLPGARTEPDPAIELAERALRHAAIELASAKLLLRFQRDEGEYLPTLATALPLALEGVDEARTWLVTADPSTAVDALALGHGESVALTRCASASATGLVAFELRSAATGVRKCFTLNLATEGMPHDRDAQIVRVVVHNSDRFLAYLLCLLDGLDPNALSGVGPDTAALGITGSGPGFAHGLLERLVRARARNPERLNELRQVVDAILSAPEPHAILPDGFEEVWAAVAPEVSP